MSFAEHRIQSQLVGEVGGEIRHPHPEGGLFRLTETRETPEARWVVVDVVKRLPRLVRALEPGQGEQIVVVDVPIYLGIVLGRIRAIVGDVRIFERALVAETQVVGGLSRVVLFGGQEEEQPVLDDRAADVGVVDRLLGILGRVVAVQQARWIPLRGRQRIGVIGILEAVLQEGRLHQGAHAKVPVVGAALADLVDHAADGAAIFGAVAADEGLLFLYGAIRQLETALCGERIGDIHAVDVVGILGCRSTAEHIDRVAQRTAAQLGRAHADTRRQRRDVGGVTLQGQALQVLCRHRGDLIGRGHVDRGDRPGGDDDGVQGCRGRRGGCTGKDHRHCARGDGTDARLGLHDLAVLQQGYGVGTDWNGGRVSTGRVHVDGAVEAGATGDPDGLPGSHRNRTLDRAGGRLPPGGAREAHYG